MRLQDTSRIFNTARIEALELENLMDIAMATMMSAAGSRRRAAAPIPASTFRSGTMSNWLKHTLYFCEGDRLDFRPVRTRPLSVETFPPKPRVY